MADEVSGGVLPIDSKSTVSPYRSNYFLFIWPFIGVWFFYWGIAGGLVFAIISSILVYIDAKKIGAGKDSKSLAPWKWGIIVFFIITYPVYLFSRRKIYETVHNVTGTSIPAKKIVAGIVGVVVFFLICIIIFGLSAMPSLPSTVNSPATTNSPEKSLQEYFSAINEGNGSAVYNLLSADIQYKNPFSRIAGIVKSFHDKGYTISNLKVTSKTGGGDHYILGTSYTLNINGHSVFTEKTIDLVKENGKWKINTYS